ncbi:hypothetical protein OS493_031768 [Desmophyllum pertusum]|uniref:Uncharacterized protein n=1 Tax=Desmophyllum pertusum TaxID=174260 RepID=A0A9X0CXB6_9CNID|nr:hypothetical protein OS493_031768 [Desmophyllum pertusum]
MDEAEIVNEQEKASNEEQDTAAADRNGRSGVSTSTRRRNSCVLDPRMSESPLKGRIQVYPEAQVLLETHTHAIGKLSLRTVSDVVKRKRMSGSLHE